MSEATVSPTGFTNETFEAFLESRNEPSWLTDQRRAAWKQFSEMAMPSRSEEEWMRTDVRTFKFDQYSLPLQTTDASAQPSVLAQNIETAGAIASVNGHLRSTELDESWKQKGVVYGSLTKCLSEHEELIKPRLLESMSGRKGKYADKFAALHSACWSTGTFLYVPRGVVVKLPLHSMSTIAEGGIDFGHTLIVLEEGAEATVLNEMGSPVTDAHGLHCGATNLSVANGGHLRFVNLQDWGLNVWHFAQQRATVGRDASLQWTVGALGSRLSKVNQEVVLAGVGAECQVNGVMFTEGRQHLSYHTRQHHAAPSCRSDFLYKAALQDKSRTVWRGMIQVDEAAQKTDGYQRNDNLLLSNAARADAIPGLEIEADDVRCTHGSTTGKVDEELIFYAQSRGFTRKEAIRLVVTGFFQQVFDRITIESVRNALGFAIARRVRDYE